MLSSKRSIFLLSFISLLFVTMMVSCSNPAPTATSPLVKEYTPSSTPKILTIPPTEKSAPTEIATIIPTQSISGREINLPLSEPGEYFTGKKVYSFVDAARKNRKVSITVWYPAIRPVDFKGNYALKDAELDISGAPYPLIISSSKVGNIFAAHLASYGFIIAGVELQDSYQTWEIWLIDFPLDQLFILDQIGAGYVKELKGVVDTEHTGAMGYSFDGYNALAMSGARVDPVNYSSQCMNANTIQPPLPKWWINYNCALQDKWPEFAAHAGADLTMSEDGLWQPMTDPRIKAVMPMAPEGAWLFGERGLAAVDRPVLIIGAQLDNINYYLLETAFIYDHILNTEKTLITFMNEGHMMVMDTASAKKMKHFAVAFFGYHLQNKAEYRDYYSEDFISKYPDFYWGVYTGK